MVDIETLATTFNAVIVSIGAVKFNLDEGIVDEFYINLNGLDGRQYDCVIDPDTINWWKTQPAAARDAWQKSPRPYKEALEAFCEWYGPASVPTWAKGGPKFDFPILEHSMKKAGVVVPWQYYHCFDYRTLLHVTKINDVKLKSKGSTYHNALDDAKEQTKLILPILQGFQHWEAF